MSQSIQTPEGHPGPAASVASSALSPMAAFSARHQTLPAGDLKSKLIKGLAIGAGLLTLACSANFWLADNYFGSPAAAPANQVGTGYAQELKEADNEGEVLVVADLQDGTTYEEAQALAERYNLDFKYNSPYSGGNALFVTSIKAKDLDSTLQKLAQEPLVEAAEPNYVYKLTPPATDSKTNSDSPLKASGAVFDIPNQPNDPLYKYQWNFQMLNVPQAWTWSRGRGAVAAVIDTGVAWQAAEDRPAMEDLAQTKIVKGYDFVNHNDLALDDNCHGTHVAGTIAQSTNNELGVAGIANEAAIMPIKVLSGMGFGSLSDIADGIRFAADRGANVINMSLGGPMDSHILANAVKYANRKGVLVVCAAGNESRNEPSYPAAYREAIAVSSVDSRQEIAWYSNYGKHIDIAAPGGDTRQDYNGDGMVDGICQNTLNPQDDTEQGYYPFQGTSMASPHVAGAATLLAAQGINNPKAMRSILTGSAVKPNVSNPKIGYGAGIVNANKAVRKAGLLYGFGRLTCAVLLSLWALQTLLKRNKLADMVLFSSTALVGSCGLFFLPLFTQLNLGPLTVGMPSWDLYLLGARGHGNLLFYSALIPSLLAFAVMNKPAWRSLAAGLCCGFAGAFLFEAIFGSVYLRLIPASLQGLWLCSNCSVLFLMGHVLVMPDAALFAADSTDSDVTAVPTAPSVPEATATSEAPMTSEDPVVPNNSDAE